MSDLSAFDPDLDPFVAPDLGHSALLVIDMQADFLDTGSNAVVGTTQVVPTIARLVRAYRSRGLPIVHVVRLYDGDDVDLPRRSAIAAGALVVRPGTPGSAIVDDLLPHPGLELDAGTLLSGGLQNITDAEWAVWKPRWGAFHRTTLHDHLAGLGVTTVVIAGCNYPNCPRATSYAASEHDYRTMLVRDGISGLADTHLAEAGRIGVTHASAEELIAAVLDTPTTTVGQVRR